MSFTFAEKLKEVESYNNTMIVDALNLCFRWKHTAQYNTFRYEFQSTVKSLAKSYHCDKIIIAADWGASTYRRNLYPEYKADRAEKFKDQTEQERIAFEEFFEEYEETLKLMAEDYIVLRYKGVEADDIAAHIVKDKTKYGLNTIWLISSDRDWDLLIAEDVHRFSFRTRKETKLDNWDEHYEVPPEDYISYKCLMGDPGDNVPGIVGIGPKRAAQLIGNFGSALDIYDTIPIRGTAQYIRNLNENKDIILRNYELMDLLSYCDEAIGEENLQNIRTSLGELAW